MNLEPLIQEIVYSEDPVTTFSKVAADLDDRWKVTLAREVNKALFQKKLQETPLNENIEFNVIEVPQMHKIASEEPHQNFSFEKRASANDELKKKITPDMFMFNEINTTPKKATSYQDDGLLKQATAEEIKRELETQTYIAKEEEKRLQEAQKFFIEQERDVLLRKIASEIPDTEHLKTFVKMALKEGLEYEAERVMEHFDPDLHYFTKTAAAVLTLDEKVAYEQYINDLKELEKKSALPQFIKGVVNTGARLTGMGLNVIGRVGSVAARLPGIAAKTVHGVGSFVYKHPFVTTIGIAGGAAALRSGKFTDETLLGR